MRLAKPRIDIGLFTDDIEAQRKFWGEVVGLRLDHELELAPGWIQHRYDAYGSVIKVNHLAGGVPDRPPSGITRLTVAVEGIDKSWMGGHPGGDRVLLVPPGGAVAEIGVTLTSADPERMIAFYREALDFEECAPGVLRLGNSLLTVVEGPSGTPYDDDVIGPGFRYLTIQVFDADAEAAEVVRRGGRIVREFVNVAGVARYGFVADPDGNWIELSARTSLTGIEVHE
jgi:lactoylglutathione lyase